MLLRNIAANNTVTKDLVALIEKQSPLLSQFIHFYKKPGNSATSRKEQEGIGVQTRSLDQAFTPKIVKPDYETAGRKIIGDTARLDVVREDMGFDIASEMTSQVKRIVPKLVAAFHNMLINGNSVTKAEEFDGLKNMVSANQIIKPGGANGHKIELGRGDAPAKSAQLFLESLDEALSITAGTNRVLLCNGKMFARISSVARNWITWSKNEFGVPIAYYNMIPIVNMDVLGENAIPNTEVKGTSKDCSSIYVASFEEESGVSFLTTENGFRAYDMKRVDNFYEVMVHLVCDSILLRDKAITRIEGLRV